ncbi:MAG TPA: efflux RND transporter periplasmic adaptor subunit [Vicinamibacteria bacterium]|nr:efflux RND transporter periplasmic adaptor subunit [Vicinamibacteria bacterium]
MTGKTKKILGAVVGITVIGAIVGFSVARENSKKTLVQTGKVEKKDLVQVVTASGEVRPKRYVNVGANVSGRLIEITVKEGDAVKQGQVLAKVESERYQAIQRQSEAGLAAGNADLARAEADLAISKIAFDRIGRMRQQRLVSEQDYDQAEADFKMKTANVDAARRRVAQLQAARDSTKDDLVKTTVIAPMDGQVTNLPMEAGEMVIGAMSFQPTTIMTVADLSVMECQVMVDETDFRNLKLGQEAKIKVDALEGLELKGEVTEIGASALVRGSGSQSTVQTTLGANTGNQPKDFKVTITIKNPPANLRPGLNATADITTASRSKVVAVPVQAVVVREVNKQGKVVDPDSMASGGQGTERQGDTVTQVAREKGQEKDGVFVVQGEKAVFKPVKTGVMGETDIEVTEGLAEGQEIVTGSYRTLRTLKDEAVIKAEPKGKKS